MTARVPEHDSEKWNPLSGKITLHLKKKLQRNRFNLNPIAL
jgi:hypothetical protein